MTIAQWSTTAANNASGVTGINWAEGQAPSTVNDSAREEMAQVATWLGQASGAIPEYLTGVAGTNTVTAGGPSQLASYVAGQRFTFLPANTNTGATTMNITPSGASALGAKNIFVSGQACVGGELVANIPATILYDGTQFNILSKVKAPTVQVYTSTGANTWNKPTGLAYVIAEVWSAGGGGGTAGSGGGTSSAGGGGGGGAYSRKRILVASLGSTETATVGAGGASASAGGTSSFGAHISITGGAAGGNGGVDGNGAGGAGGTASSGDFNGVGQTGNSGDRAGGGGGHGANSPLGGGGIESAGTGNAATGKSAGGGGAFDNAAGSNNGGAGSNGLIVVTEFYS